MKKKIKIMLVLVALILSCFLSCFSNNNLVVYASNISVAGGYTNVLEDLQTDATFNVEDYPLIENDYSLQVITIAESNEKELFVYVYQPSAEYQNLVATAIHFSTAYHSKSNFKDYKLTLLDSQGVFYKYVVSNFIVSSDALRNYEVKSIFRAWNENFDADADGNNIVNEVAYNVSKIFTFKTMNGVTTLSVNDAEYITITEKLVGFVRYDGDKPAWMSDATAGCDSHIVAFSTDREIEELLEADIYYMQRYKYGVCNGYHGPNGEMTFTYSYGEYQDSYAYLENTDLFEFIGEDYDFNGKRIQKVSDFIESEKVYNEYSNIFIKIGQYTELTEQAEEDLRGKEWVLRFTETEYRIEQPADTPYEYSTEVSNVSILRLKFKTDGIVYDLGVIDNKQTGSGNPLNQTTYEYSLSDTFKIILALLLLLILCVVFAPILPVVFNVLGAIIKIVFKILIAILSAPFKLIKWVTNKGKK